jgi:hypothetical protein
MRARRTIFSCLLSAELLLATSPAAARPAANYAAADVGVTVKTLEYISDGDSVENLVLINAVNHGPDDVSSFVATTCLADPPPIQVTDTFPGGCNSYGLVSPCAEFGLGFRFGRIAQGESTQCLARIRGPLPRLPAGLRLYVGRLVEANDEFMLDPNSANDTIELNPVAAPSAHAAVPALSIATQLGLMGLLTGLGFRRMSGKFRGH